MSAVMRFSRLALVAGLLMLPLAGCVVGGYGGGYGDDGYGGYYAGDSYGVGDFGGWGRGYNVGPYGGVHPGRCVVY